MVAGASLLWTAQQSLFRRLDENRTVLANYIFDQKKIDPSADKNWGFAPIKEAVNVTFETTPSAKGILSRKDIISYVGEGKDGFGKYQISLE
mgnify:CR=1 FL=1